MNKQKLQGNWNEITGKLRSKWGELTGDDLDKVKGDAAQLVGLIQRKTGETREQIEQYIDDLTAEGAHGINRTLEAANEYASQAVETARDSAENVAQRFREGYETAEKTMQQRPVQSAAMAFGAGIVAGVLLAVIIRPGR